MRLRQLERFDPDLRLGRRDGAYIDLDFCRRDFRIGKLRTAHLLSLPGFTYTGGAGFKTSFDQAGAVVGPFAANDPGLTDRGLGIWAASTNLLLGSAAPATQSVTVAASQYTLSFQGTGAVALSGASTAGPLTGTGASDFVKLSFTPSAGTLTLTISGDVRNANLELGFRRTPWIPTTVAAATRTADVPRLGLGRQRLPVEWTVLVERETYGPTGDFEFSVKLRNTATPSGGQNTVFMGRNASGGEVCQVTDNTVSDLVNSTTGGLGLGVHRAAFAISPSTAPTVIHDGGNLITGSAAGVVLIDNIDFGSDQAGSGYLSGFLRRVIVLPRRLGVGDQRERSRWL